MINVTISVAVVSSCTIPGKKVLAVGGIRVREQLACIAIRLNPKLSQDKNVIK